MRPWIVVVLVAVAGFAGWAFAAPGEREEGRTGGRGARGRFLDALSPGDRIELPQYLHPGPDRDRDGVDVQVLSEQWARDRTMTTEEMDELTRLTEKLEKGIEVDRERLRELQDKLRWHPEEVVEVGEDFVAYRTRSGVTYLPERRIKTIWRPLPEGRNPAPDAATP